MLKFYLGGGVFDSTLDKNAVIFTLQTLWGDEDFGFTIDFDYKVNKKSIEFTFKRDMPYQVTGGCFLIDRDMMMLTGLPVEAFDPFGKSVIWPVVMNGANYYGDKQSFTALYKYYNKKYAGVKLKRVIIDETDDTLVLKLMY